MCSGVMGYSLAKMKFLKRIRKIINGTKEAIDGLSNTDFADDSERKKAEGNVEGRLEVVHEMLEVL